MIMCLIMSAYQLHNHTNCTYRLHPPGSQHHSCKGRWVVVEEGVAPAQRRQQVCLYKSLHLKERRVHVISGGGCFTS